MLQRFIIVGNLGAAPELRYTAAGTACARFPVAVNRKWTDDDGRPQEETTWFRVVVWGKQAEACSQYLSKGRRVMVEGERIRASAYLNKDNLPTASLELTARSVHFLDAASRSNGNGNGNGNGARQAELALVFASDDLPF